MKVCQRFFTADKSFPQNRPQQSGDSRRKNRCLPDFFELFGNELKNSGSQTPLSAGLKRLKSTTI
jgi:hypothetical protein